MPDYNCSCVFWFRQDLRLEDNPGLVAAAEEGSVLPIFIDDQDKGHEWSRGAASKVWLYHSLKSLNDELNGSLRFFSGNPKTILINILKTYGAKTIIWNRLYDKRSISRDTKLKADLVAQGYKIKTYNASLLWEPWDVCKEDGTPYKVFTPFYRKGCVNGKTPRFPLKKPKLILAPNDKFCGFENLKSLKLLEGKTWESKIADCWEIGEKAALRKFQLFIENGLNGYKEGRNFPIKSNVSRLSPHLHFGEISINKVWYEVKALFDNKKYKSRDIDHFLSELGWREFSFSLLYNNPDLPKTNLQKRFNNFPWVSNKKHFDAWKHGRTGFPIVDAGMRQLYKTGYMHNRLRMIVGSFLVKNLLINWRDGQNWFWNCLVDADLANNSAGWQWIAGCGADAAPYFRIFNPITQGLKFDPEGRFIRHFVPEIASLPTKYIFSPVDAPNDVLLNSNVILGKDYPEPIIELQSSRLKALEAFANTKN